MEWLYFSIVFGRETRRDKVNIKIIFGDDVILKNRLNGVGSISTSFYLLPHVIITILGFFYS